MLNARRHRRGKRIRVREHEDGRRMCSTPEGIGAENGRCLTWVAHSCDGAQRPKASARKTDGAGRGWSGSSRSAQRPKASARKTAKRRTLAKADSKVLNARRHRRGKRGHEVTDLLLGVAVLNARRHRRGKRFCDSDRKSRQGRCSTPEGIGAENGPVEHGSAEDNRLCSTPEGIGAENGTRPTLTMPLQRGAQRPKASARKTDPTGS